MNVLEEMYVWVLILIIRPVLQNRFGSAFCGQNKNYGFLTILHGTIIIKISNNKIK